MAKARRDLGERLNENVKRQPWGCWTWTGRTHATGGGRIKVFRDGRWVEDTARRVAWELAVGQIPEGHRIRPKDGVCPDPTTCVAPQHSEVYAPLRQRSGVTGRHVRARLHPEEFEALAQRVADIIIERRSQRNGSQG
jgi:hypothetical protein